MNPSPEATKVNAHSQADRAGELAALQHDFPLFRIWREDIGDRVRYVALRRRPGIHPHTLVTAD